MKLSRLAGGQPVDTYTRIGTVEVIIDKLACFAVNTGNRSG